MVRAYRDTDFNDVMKWLEKRNMPKIDKTVLSDTGFIIPDVACVFLYLTNSSVCNLENMYSNPDAENRSLAIELLLDTALKAAKTWEYKYVQSISTHKEMIKRAVIRGAKFETNQTIMTLKI